jgi:predicted nucleotidyltransferase
MITQSQIQSFGDDLVRRYNPRKIILFGSHAYGMPHEYSDADVLVVMDFEGNGLEKAAEMLVAISPRFAVDLIVRTPERLQDRITQGDIFLKTIMTQGKVIYEQEH